MFTSDSPLPWCELDTFFNFSAGLVHVHKDKTMCTQCACAQKCCLIIGQTVRRVKRQILRNICCSLQYIMELRQVIFMMVLTWSAYQQTQVDGTCDHMIRQRALMLNNLTID